MDVRGKHYAAVLGTSNPGCLRLVLDVAGVDIEDDGFIEFRSNFGWLYLGKGEAWADYLNWLNVLRDLD